jgi:hypothetical protein
VQGHEHCSFGVNATVLERVKRWVLAVLAMLDCSSLNQTVMVNKKASAMSEEQSARGCARLRSRREERRFLTRSVRRGVLRVSGRRASPTPPCGRFRLACGASNKGQCEERSGSIQIKDYVWKYFA